MSNTIGKHRPQDSATLYPLAVSKRQAAMIVGLSVSSLEKRVDDFVTFRVGSRLLFPVRELDAWVARKVAETAAARQEEA